MIKLIISLMLYTSLSAITIEQDKVKHMVEGTLIYATCYYALGFSEKECLLPVYAAAIGKEAYDEVSGMGTSDFNDITATVFVPMVTFAVYEW